MSHAHQGPLICWLCPESTGLAPCDSLPPLRAHRLQGPHRPSFSALSLSLPKSYFCRKLSKMAPDLSSRFFPAFLHGCVFFKVLLGFGNCSRPSAPMGNWFQDHLRMLALRILGSCICKFCIHQPCIHGCSGPTGSYLCVSLFSAHFPRSLGVRKA